MKKTMMIAISIFCFSAISASAATTITCNGKGGATSNPNGTVVLCPIESTKYCGTIKQDANAHASDVFTDIAIHFDEEGNIDDEFNCKIVGWDEPTDQPILWREGTVIDPELIPKKIDTL